MTKQMSTQEIAALVETLATTTEGGNLDLLKEASRAIAQLKAAQRRGDIYRAELHGEKRAFLQLITEGIKMGGSPDLEELNRNICQTDAQAGIIRETVEKLIEHLDKEGIRSRDMTVEKGLRLLDLVEFYVFHEVHRIAHYIQRYVARDMRLNLASVTEKPTQLFVRPDPAAGVADINKEKTDA